MDVMPAQMYLPVYGEGGEELLTWEGANIAGKQEGTHSLTRCSLFRYLPSPSERCLEASLPICTVHTLGYLHV